eukprot:591521-Pyramimonas_sp.AAC.1
MLPDLRTGTDRTKYRPASIASSSPRRLGLRFVSGSRSLWQPNPKNWTVVRSVITHLCLCVGPVAQMANVHGSSRSLASSLATPSMPR